MSREHFLGRMLTWPFLGEEFTFSESFDSPFSPGMWCQTWDTSPGWKQRRDTHSHSPQSKCAEFNMSKICFNLKWEKRVWRFFFRYYSVKKRSVWPGSNLSPIVTNIHKRQIIQVYENYFVNSISKWFHNPCAGVHKKLLNARNHNISGFIFHRSPEVDTLWENVKCILSENLKMFHRCLMGG